MTDRPMSARNRVLINPFDAMRANRVLAPHDTELNDIRWLIGEDIRQTHDRARLDALRAGLPQSEVALHARARLREAEDRVGPAAWPILTRIVIEGGGVRECRGFVTEFATHGRTDAVVTDRLRCALDRIGALMGVTSTRYSHE